MKLGVLERRKWDDHKSGCFDYIPFQCMRRWVISIISQEVSAFLFCASTAGWWARALSVSSSARGGCRACGASCWMSSCDPSCWARGGAAEDSASTWLKSDTLTFSSLMNWPGAFFSCCHSKPSVIFFYCDQRKLMTFLSPNPDLGWRLKQCEVITNSCLFPFSVWTLLAREQWGSSLLAAESLSSPA